MRCKLNGFPGHKQSRSNSPHICNYVLCWSLQQSLQKREASCSNGGGVQKQWRLPPRPVCPRVTRRQSTHRASAAGGQDPAPRRPLPALRAALGHTHAQVLHGSGVCAPHPPPPPRAQLRPEVSPPVFCRAPQVRSCWHLLLGQTRTPGASYRTVFPDRLSS